MNGEFRRESLQPRITRWRSVREHYFGRGNGHASSFAASRIILRKYRVAGLVAGALWPHFAAAWISGSLWKRWLSFGARPTEEALVEQILRTSPIWHSLSG